MKAKNELTGVQQGLNGRRNSWIGYLGWLAMMYGSWTHADALRLQSAEVAALPGDQIRLDLELSGPAEKPAVFHTENPARIALDFPGVTNGLERKSIPIDTGLARSLNAVEAEGRTRVVLNLLSMAPYEVETSGNHVFLTLRNQEGKSTGVAGVGEGAAPVKFRAGGDALAGQTIENIDFMRGDKGEGRVQITLADPNTIADMREEAGNVIVYFLGATVPDRLQKRLDVTDFASPVKTVETMQEGSRAKIIVSPSTEDYDYLSYQTDNVMTIEFRPLTRAEKEAKKEREFAYTGDRLSLNFQDIPVRSVLQILADFTGLNMVASDSVQGNVTLRLNDVPWDQALEVVLKSKGLAKRQEGNVVRIGPTEEIKKLEAEEVAAQKIKEKLEPIRTELIAIKYANVADIQKLLTVEQRRTGSQNQQNTSISNEIESEEQTQSLLSDRGSVSVDERTNTLIVKDTASSIERIRRLVAELDVPVRQVLIESRIVIANDDFSRQLGVQFQASKTHNPNGKGTVSNIGGRTGDSPVVDTAGNILGQRLVDLPVANPFGAMGITVLEIGDYLLDLELSALQTEEKGEILSNPRLLTSDYKEATITQGFECPYTAAGTAGQGNAVATISFKKAVLELKVTPHITPDDSVVLDLDIKKDDPDGPCGTATQPAIQTRQVKTTVQVANGDTVVLGGVYENTKAETLDKVPFFGDIPGVGRLFKRISNSDTKRELLIFITPKVVKNMLVSSK
ncbi:MAG TPA: type IV pilus secretin PilQ [Methylococcaceae bacterium]|nr:type IV pilus secretin PilQ [Methylococcaceae bacterium]